jgi:hypothetical protein
VNASRAAVILASIKAFHSAVFLVMLAAIGWLVATGIIGRRDRSVALAAGLVAIESGVFIANDGVCPLTPLAERYGARRGGVSDIFLPDAVARTIPIWATSLVVLSALLHLRSLLAGRTQPTGRIGGARSSSSGRGRPSSSSRPPATIAAWT